MMVTSHKMKNFTILFWVSRKKPVQKRNPRDYSHPITKDIKEFFENLLFYAKLFCILYMSLKLHNPYCYSLDTKVRSNLLRYSTSVLFFGCWLMNHVTYLKLRQKLLLLNAEQNHNYFHSKWWFFFSNLTIVSEKKLICSDCNNNYFCLSLR